MRILFFSDLHVYSWPEHNPEQRLTDCVSVLSEIREYCNDNNIRHVFFGGDLFHKRGVLFTRAYAMVTHELRLYKEQGITFYAVDGNHDHEDKEGLVHALQPLMDGELVEGVEDGVGWRNVELETEDYGNHVLTVSMFSYSDNRALLKRRIKASVEDRTLDPQYIPCVSLFHHGFKGARVGSTLEYVVKEPMSAQKLKLDRTFDLTLCGHYHAHQRIKGLKYGWYIGSPLEHTRSDYQTEEERFKGFIVVDSERPRTFTKVSLVRPRFVKLDATSVFTIEQVQGNFVDLHYSDREALDSARSALTDLGVRAIKAIPRVGAKASTKRRLDVDPTLSPKKVLTRYVKYKRKEAAEIAMPRKQLTTVGLDLLQEALQG